MADFQPGRQLVFERLDRRMKDYRANQSIKAVNHESTFHDLVDQESKRTVQLKQKYTEPKNKNKGRREKKDTSNQSNMGQMKMLARPHDSSEDNLENPSKKPRLSGPCQAGPPLVPQSASGSGPGVPPYKNNIPTPSTIDNYHMGQQQISLQNVKKNGSPPPPILLPPSIPPTSSASNTLANSSSLDDIKKEDLDLNDMNGVFSFDDFQLLKGIDLDNLYEELNNGVKTENPFLLGPDDVDEIEELIARDSVSDTNSFSTVPNVPSTFMTSNCTNSTTPSSSQSFSNLPNEDPNAMRPSLPQSNLPVTQPNTNNPAATTLKNMAQVHQKQQYNPTSIRPQTYPDYNNPRMGPGGGLGPINNMMQNAPQNPQAMYSQSNMVPQQYPRQQMMVRPHGPSDQCPKGGTPMGSRIPSPHTAPVRQMTTVSQNSNDSQSLAMRNMSVSNSIPNNNKLVNSINRAVTPTTSNSTTSISTAPTTTPTPSTAISKPSDKAASTPPSSSTASSTPPHSEPLQYQQMMQSSMAGAGANYPNRISPNMYQGGAPAGQYPGGMMRPGMRPAYHRGPTPQGQVGVDGKMSQEMYYGTQMSSQQQYAMMGGGQPPRYPGGQMMMRGMNPQQMMQAGQVMGGNRPPPPEYRHATTMMQQQQQMMMYPSSIRQGMNPMTSMSNGVSQSGPPMVSNQNMSGSMPQQAQNLPPSLPSMKSGGSPGMQQSMGVPNMSHLGGQMMSRNCPPGMIQSGHPMMMTNQRGQMMMRAYPQQQPSGMMVQGSQQMMGMQRAGSGMIYPPNMGSMPGQMQPGMGGQMQPGMQQMQPGMGGQMQPGMQQMQPGMGGQMQPGMASQMQSGMPGQMQPGMMSQMQSGMHGAMPQSVRMQHSMGSSMAQMQKGIAMSQNGGPVMQSQYPGQVNPMSQMAGHNGQMAVQGGQMTGVNGQMTGHAAQMAGARRMGPSGADAVDKDPMGSCNGQMTGMPSPANSHHLMGGVRSPANMGHQQGGNMSPAQMGGGMNGAPSPANMGPGMAHPRSPAGMLHPRSPATSVGGRPLSNPGIGGQSPLPGKNNPPSSLPSQQRPPSVGGRNSQPPTPNQSHSGGGNTPHHSATSPPQTGLEFDNYLNSYDPSASQPNFESLIDHN